MSTEATGYVYFIQGGGLSGLIKIGFTADPLKRLRTLQIGSPVSLTILGVKLGVRGEERQLHQEFEGLRHHGEWFFPAPELLGAIPDRVPVGAVSQVCLPHCWNPHRVDVSRRRNQQRGFKRILAPFEERKEKELQEEVYLISQLGDDD